MLTPLQQRVARIVASLPQARGFALAGGAALVVARVVDRSTKDLDFIDVAALVERFGLDRLCELAKEKDAGFSRPVLRDMLGGFDRFGQTDFGLDDTTYHELARQVRQWRATLSSSPSRTIDPPNHDPGLGL